MDSIRFKKKIITARIRNPLQNFSETKEQIEIRIDPLSGYSSRISKSKGLDKIPEDDPLPDFASQSKSCFFCKGRVEEQTPKMPDDIDPGGRIAVGEAFLFPNLSGFGMFSAVCIFSNEHFIAIDQFNPTQIFNALKACQIYFQRCSRSYRSRLFPSINGNYLLPGGSSILHPHLQPFLDPFPTNFQRQLWRASKKYYWRHQKSYWTELKKVERNSERFLFETQAGFAYTPFAPLGFYEVNAIVGNGENLLDFSDEMLRELSEIIWRIFQFYHSRRHNSFNLVLFSPPIMEGETKELPCLLKICTRPVFTAFYRNDVTFFEKFHQETMIDKAPEEVAAEFRATIK